MIALLTSFKKKKGVIFLFLITGTEIDAPNHNNKLDSINCQEIGMPGGLVTYKSDIVKSQYSYSLPLLGNFLLIICQ